MIAVTHAAGLDLYQNFAILELWNRKILDLKWFLLTSDYGCLVALWNIWSHAVRLGEFSVTLMSIQGCLVRGLSVAKR